MRRVILFLAVAVLALGLAAPAVLAAQPTFDHTGTALMAFNGDVTVPAGDVADAVFVTGGTATIHGKVETVVVLDGSADPPGCHGPFGGRDRRLGQRRWREHRHWRHPDARSYSHRRPGSDRRR